MNFGWWHRLFGLLLKPTSKNDLCHLCLSEKQTNKRKYTDAHVAHEVIFFFQTFPLLKVQGRLTFTLFWAVFARTWVFSIDVAFSMHFGLWSCAFRCFTKNWAHEELCFSVYRKPGLIGLSLLIDIRSPRQQQINCSHNQNSAGFNPRAGFCLHKCASAVPLHWGWEPSEAFSYVYFCFPNVMLPPCTVPLLLSLFCFSSGL